MTHDTPPNSKTQSASSQPVILDAAIFEQIRTLMGADLSTVLTRYFDTARGYVDTIRNAVETNDFKAMRDAAHPLKSSSQQLGAMQVAALAKEIEHLGCQATPDAARLQKLAEQLAQALAHAVQALAHAVQALAAQM